MGTSYYGHGSEIRIEFIGPMSSRQKDAVELIKKSLASASYTLMGQSENSGFMGVTGSISIEPNRKDAVEILNSKILGQSASTGGKLLAYVQVGYAGIHPKLKAPGVFVMLGAPEISVDKENISFNVPIMTANGSSNQQSRRRFKKKTLLSIFKDIWSQHGFNVKVDSVQAQTVLNEIVSLDQTESDYLFIQTQCKKRGLVFVMDYKSSSAFHSTERIMIFDTADNLASQKPVAKFLLYAQVDELKNIYLIDTFSTDPKHSQFSDAFGETEIASVDPNKKEGKSEKFGPKDSKRTVYSKYLATDEKSTRFQDGSVASSLSDTKINAVKTMPSRGNKNDVGYQKENKNDIYERAIHASVGGPGVGFLYPMSLVTSGMDGVTGILSPTIYQIKELTYSVESGAGFRFTAELTAPLPMGDNIDTTPVKSNSADAGTGKTKGVVLKKVFQ